jgi:hypothetical protein
MAIFDGFDADTIATIAGALGNYAQYSAAQKQQALANQRYEDERAFQQQQFDAQRGDVQYERGLAQQEKDKARDDQLIRLAAEAEDYSTARNFLDTLDLAPPQRAAIEAMPFEQQQTTILELMGASAPQAPAKPVVVGDALVDPRTGQPIYQAADKPQETFQQGLGSDFGLTGEAATKPFQRSNITGKLSQIGGGGVTVNTGDKVEQATAIANAKAGVDRQAELAERQDAIDATISSLDQIEATIGSAPTGAGAETRTAITNLAETYGGKGILDFAEDVTESDYSVDVEAAQLEDQAIKSLVASRAKTFGANPTEGERKALESTVIKPSDKPEVKRKKAAVMRAQADYAKAAIAIESQLITDGKSPAEAKRLAREQLGDPPTYGTATKQATRRTTAGGITYEVER